MNMMPKERVDVKEALKVMLPLIKDYLRLGAYAGAGAVVRPTIRDDRRSYRLTGLGH